MFAITTEPIRFHWTTDDERDADKPTATATAVTEQLARIDVADVDRHLVPYLSAAAAELALLACIPWTFSPDDPPVALIRIVAKVSMRVPHASGPHTARLFEQLG